MVQIWNRKTINVEDFLFLFQWFFCFILCFFSVGLHTNMLLHFQCTIRPSTRDWLRKLLGNDWAYKQHLAFGLSIKIDVFKTIDVLQLSKWTARMTIRSCDKTLSDCHLWRCDLTNGKNWIGLGPYKSMFPNFFPRNGLNGVHSDLPRPKYAEIQNSEWITAAKLKFVEDLPAQIYKNHFSHKEKIPVDYYICIQFLLEWKIFNLKFGRQLSV